MRTTEDLTGKEFSRWMVLKSAPRTDHNPRWWCRCICGIEKSVLSCHLKSGKSASCGCLNREVTSQSRTTHGMSSTREYRVWKGMKSRCYRKRDKRFADYGGRGISVAPEWIVNFEQFLKDMGPMPVGYSIERRNVNGNYEAGNCEWIPVSDQANNKRKTVHLTAEGMTMSLNDWAKELGVYHGQIRYFLAKGTQFPEIAIHFRNRVKP